MKALKTVAIIGFISVILLLGALRLWGDALTQHAVRVHWGVELARDIDHRMKPGEKTGLNSDNIRATREANASDDAFNVIFLGDSYVFGLGLDVNEAPPAQLEKRLRAHYQTDRINVWNFGWISSSPYLSLRLLKDLGDKYQPDLVIINVDMTDFKDDYFYRRMLDGEGMYSLAKSHPYLFFHIKNIVAYVPLLKPLHQMWFGYPDVGDYFIARQPMEASRVYFATVRDSLDQTHDYVSERWHVPFVAFLSPRHWQYTDRESPDSWESGGFDVLGPYALEPFRYFDEIGDTLEYPLVSLLPDFQQTDRFPLSFRHDSHWNPAGARFAAEAIFQHCQALGCFSPLDERFVPSRQSLAPSP